MHEINTDYYKVVIEDRRKMATEFFYKRHVTRLQYQDQQTELSTVGSLSAIRRLVRSILRIARRRTRSHAVEKAG